MKRQNLQGSRQDRENKEKNRHQQSNITENVSKEQPKDNPRQAGLGRDRISEIEEPGGRDDYAGGDRDDISVEDSDDALA